MKVYMCLLGDPDPSMRFCGLFGALETEYLFTFANQLKFGHGLKPSAGVMKRFLVNLFIVLWFIISKRIIL